MKNKEYWQKRFVMLEESQMKKGSNYYASLDKEFQKAMAGMERDIQGWYQRFADDNQVTMAEARKMLKGKELQELRWDVEDYIKHGKENALNQKWMTQLENASSRYHISRLEALQLQLQQHAEVLFGNHLDSTDKLLREIYQGGYYKAAYEIQKGLGVGSSFDKLDTRRIDKVLAKPWTTDNKTFSDRIWNNKDKLVNEVHSKLTQMMIRGEAPDKTIKAIAKQMNVSKAQAGRLVMTESAFFASAAQKDCFNELGVEKFEILATLDSGTCSECGSLEGTPIDMKEYQEGVTAPPFHPNCRCVASPYFDDEFSQIGERIARDEEGNTYDVPANMTYEQWKEQHVDGKQTDEKLAVSSVVKEIQPLIDNSNVNEQTQKLFDKYLTEENVCIDKNNKNILYYDRNSGKIVVNPNHELWAYYDSVKAFTHEIVHFIDDQEGISYQVFKMLPDNIQSAKEIILSDFKKYNDLFNNDEISNNISLSDIFANVTENKIFGNFMHEENYWNKLGNKELELTADLLTVHLTNDVNAIKIIEQINPLKEIYEEMNKYVKSF